MTHKQFVVMVDYGSYEGWSIVGETDDVSELTGLYQEGLQKHGSEVVVFRVIPVEVKVEDAKP